MNLQKNPTKEEQGRKQTKPFPLKGLQADSTLSKSGLERSQQRHNPTPLAPESQHCLLCLVLERLLRSRSWSLGRLSLSLVLSLSRHPRCLGCHPRFLFFVIL